MHQHSLKEWRVIKGLTKDEIGDKLKIEPDHLSLLEEDSSCISSEILEKFLALFDISYDEIILG
ncbi:helix-turn-helix domain-containing protein [Lactococcus paracarnosus]|uniref:Helix-turn-helix transcriptional regulator n=1 Tax=Pseudolactococcus paracarnosus TaxID=2749962 RepID=A0ABT0AJ78_9LACT|nr:helix-turn-helix transcriptional regulator [Lactococcus paracarnosus]MCJ1976584.1 helix-turn-helix transcriptional regulator [Lactococcus paracarnosus]MCJ1982625.1 helix-turn-helix transcriptional regulator [Lactococcus paracarnosus]MCJ1997595.1 helix-turn-helix transcriptional regulator [Lactococcus paracarnosus]